MKRGILYCTIFVFISMLLIPFVSAAREIEPVVSTDWLAKNMGNPKLVIVDIRKVEDYKTGHIPGAVNVFFNTWAVMKAGLRNEIPPLDDLADIIGSAGISPDSLVVVVGDADLPPNRSGITRVAWTLRYTGIENVAILDGGYDKWKSDKKPLSTDAVKPKQTKYQVKVNEAIFAKKGHVIGAIGKAVIVDAREAEFYEGKKKLDFVAKAGRIKSAVNLPAMAAYNKDGTFKSRKELSDLAAKAVGTDTAKEIIVYCDTGRLCSVWVFIMSDVLGYKNVKSYDGSSEEWMKDPNAPTEP